MRGFPGLSITLVPSAAHRALGWGTALLSSGIEQSFQKPCDYLYCCGKGPLLIGYFLLAMGDFFWPVCDFLSLTPTVKSLLRERGQPCFRHTQISKYALHHLSTINYPWSIFSISLYTLQDCTLVREPHTPQPDLSTTGLKASRIQCGGEGESPTGKQKKNPGGVGTAEDPGLGPLSLGTS